MRYKIVNDFRAKGIILTAESLLDLERDLKRNIENEKELEGALYFLEHLKDCYNKIED